MDQSSSNISSQPEIGILECQKLEAMEEAISTQEDFLKFVNELPISLENKVSSPMGVRIFKAVVFLYIFKIIRKIYFNNLIHNLMQDANTIPENISSPRLLEEMVNPEYEYRR